jgi:hypothetical protein
MIYVEVQEQSDLVTLYEIKSMACSIYAELLKIEETLD